MLREKVERFQVEGSDQAGKAALPVPIYHQAFIHDGLDPAGGQCLGDGKRETLEDIPEVHSVSDAEQLHRAEAILSSCHLEYNTLEVHWKGVRNHQV